MIALWLILSYVLLSAGEYFPHRYLMHARTRFGRVFESHTLLHHGRFFGRDFEHCDDKAARYISIDTGVVYMVLASSPIWMTMLYFSRDCAVVFLICAALHGLTWTTVHREMHFPTGRLESSRLYRFWRSYHRRHHATVGCNYNVLLPLFDHLLRTT